MIDRSLPQPEIHNSAWLLAELISDTAWLAERPDAQEIGRVTACLALDELRIGQTRHGYLEDDDATHVTIAPPSMFVGNATNVAMVARAVAHHLGRGQKRSFQVAMDTFETGRQAHQNS